MLLDPGEIRVCTKTPTFSLPKTICLHKGIEVAQEGCASCGGNVQIKIFACSVHKTCTLAKDIGYVKCCATCSDYQKKLDE